MKCVRCGKIEGFDGSFHTLYCQACLDELVKQPDNSIQEEKEGFKDKEEAWLFPWE